MKISYDVGLTFHDLREFNYCIPADDSFPELKPGDIIELWAISAPYRGYQCIVQDATLSLKP